MSIVYPTRYPGKAGAVSSDYPQGSFRNRSTPATDDGTPVDQDATNDLLGFVGAILAAAGVTPNNTVDTAQSSQAYDALIALVGGSYADRLQGFVIESPVGVYDGVSLSVLAQDTAPVSLAAKPDGTAFYVGGFTGGLVHQYTATEAWKLSTVSYASKSFDPSAQGVATSLGFSSDGTKMYIGVTTGTPSIYQYTLSTPWDVSTASYDTVSKSISTESAANAFRIKPDGTALFTIGSDGTVYQYTFGTAWDLSTLSYASKSFAVTTQDATPRGIWLSDDGARMFIGGQANDKIYQYTLSTPWDVSTASYDSITMSLQAGFPSDMVMPADGARAILLDGGGNLYQYNTSFIKG